MKPLHSAAGAAFFFTPEWKAARPDGAPCGSESEPAMLVYLVRSGRQGKDHAVLGNGYGAGIGFAGTFEEARIKKR